MRKALLRRVVEDTVASSGSPFACGARAPATCTPVTVSNDNQKPQRSVAVASNLGSCSGERSALEAAIAEPRVDSVERSSPAPRRLSSDGSSNTSQPSAEAEAPGRDLTNEGRAGSPSKAELVEVLRCMLVGDEAAPRRSNDGWMISRPSTGLAVLVVDARAHYARVHENMMPSVPHRSSCSRSCIV